MTSPTYVIHINLPACHTGPVGGATKEDLSHAVEQLTQLITMKVSELEAAFTALNTTVQAIGTGLADVATEVDKVSGETAASLAAIAALQAGLGDVDLPPAAQTAFDTLTASVNNTASGLATVKSKVEAVDAQVPDTTTPPTV